MPSTRVCAAVWLLLPTLTGGCGGQASTPQAPMPAVEEWPAPDSDLSLLERDVRMAGVLAQHPPLVDRIHYADGHADFAAIMAEDDEGVDAWVPAPGGAKRQRIPHADVERIERATPDVALERRLARLVRVERDVAAGRTLSAPPPSGQPAGPATPPGADEGNGLTWDFAQMNALADLPGAADVRWWPADVSDEAGSGWIPEDAAMNRAGVWTLETQGLGHGTAAVLQITINADRLVFDHSPGYWDAPVGDLHGHWRVVVDDRERWNYIADLNAELGEAGRFPYESVSISMGAGTHVVRFELQGCDTPAAYFWAIDSVRWENVQPPAEKPRWGALKTP